MVNIHTVLVVLSAKPGKEAELKNLLLSVCEPSRHEAACIAYWLHQDLNNPAKFVLYEQWQSKAAHESQFKKPYIIALGEKIVDCLAEPYQVTFLEALLN